ncbi:hypothetical protein H9L12_10130 [Sphingomonas rhizophila]|uniref:Uncharacterized protein n=1 Tax=Sphingomonas rhizophila TaxID=2071607 RepID=A0A7G9S9W2_9SPHN|nr:hypothetical protein [Sphingomonas rhizophila]QNN64637.1 hypothetical protein H9L12_10130 [Sphingomonas rhizophila]
MKKFAKTLLAAVCFVAGAAPAAAGVLYVTDGDSSRLAIVNTATQAVTVTPTLPGQYPIAVSSSVWVGNYYGSNSSQYNLDGSPTGVTAPAADVNAVDGTTNGVYNFELGNAFTNSATVYRANLDWTNPVALFNVQHGSDLVGITYDTLSGNLWVSNNTTLFQYTLAGGLISQFNHAGGRGSLAYDTADGTLWYVSNGSNAIRQYSTSGSLLQTLNIPGLASNNWGAEFAIGATPGAVPSRELGQ